MEQEREKVEKPHQDSEDLENKPVSKRERSTSPSAAQQHKYDVEKELIMRAYEVLKWCAMGSILIFILDSVATAVVGQGSAHTAYIIRLIGTVATFVLGFLFGTGRGK